MPRGMRYLTKSEGRMNRKFVYILMFLLSVVVTPLLAQDLPTGDARNADFRLRFEAIKHANNNIPDFMKMPAGTLYSLPNGTMDELEDKDVRGIWGREFEKTYGLPYDNFLAGQKPLEVPKVETPPEEKKAGLPLAVVATTHWYQSPGFWVFLLFLASLLAATLIIWQRSRVRAGRDAETARRNSVAARRRAEESEREQRELRRTPAEIGPPMVPGGIPATDGPRLENFFEQQAANTFAERNPQYTGGATPVRIGPITAGIMHGDGQTRDLDNVWHNMHIDLPGRAAFQARFRYPDGTEEDMKAWQECMNIVRAGGGMRGFTFIANTVDGTVVETPQPPAPAPVAVPHPAIAVARIRAAAEDEGFSTIKIGNRLLTIERGVHFDMDDATGTITLSGTSFEMSVKPKRRGRLGNQTSTRTGTDK